jgi:hypothetical protein
MPLIASNLSFKLFFCILLYGSTWSHTIAETPNPGKLYVGKASADITPELPVALMGQFYLRIAEKADTPLLANVLSISTRDQEKEISSVIFVACDLIFVPDILREELVTALKGAAPEIDPSRIILTATHSHTAPVLEDDPERSFFIYPIPKEGVVPVKAYREHFVRQVIPAIKEAYSNLQPAKVSWATQRAAIGHNRRVSYADGTTQMYGNAATENFSGLEGYEDQDLQSLFFWNLEGELIAICALVACPAQVLEHLSSVNADYWHHVREKSKAKFGEQVLVLGWIGASGDLSPRPIYRKKAAERMLKLSGHTLEEAIAEQVISILSSSLETVKEDTHESLALAHSLVPLSLTKRKIKEDEYREAKTNVKNLEKEMSEKPETIANLYARKTWNASVVERYDEQQAGSQNGFKSFMHVVRLGDIAICTNQFELFTEYGIQIQARSPALQTFVIQVAGSGTYLPTSTAIDRGGYSAVIQSSVVGAEGGKELVNETVSRINAFWDGE